MERGVAGVLGGNKGKCLAGIWETKSSGRGKLTRPWSGGIVVDLRGTRGGGLDGAIEKKLSGPEYAARNWEGSTKEHV